MTEKEPREYPLKRRSEDLPEKIPGTGDFGLEAFRVYQSLLTQEQPESEASTGGFSLRDILYVLFRHKWKIAIVFLLCSAATVLYVASGASSYKSEALVFIRGDRAGISVAPAGEGNSFVRSDPGSSVQMRSEMAILMSVTVAERAVDILGVDGVIGAPTASSGKPDAKGAIPWLGRTLEKPNQWIADAKLSVMSFLHLAQPVLTRRDKAVYNIIGNMEVAATSGGSNVLSVTYKANSPEHAQKVLAAIIDSYLQSHIRTHKSLVSPEFYKSKADELKTKLAQKEQAFDRRKKELNITSLQTEKDLLLNQLNSLETRANETGAEISASQAGTSALRKTLTGQQTQSALPPAAEVRADPEFVRLRDQMVQLKLQEMDLRTKYTDTYRPLVDVRNQIKQLEKMLANQAMTTATARIAGVDPVRQGLLIQFETQRALLDGLTAREARLTTDAETLRAKLRSLTMHEDELASMQRDVMVVENEYKQYMNSFQAAEISDALDRNKVGNLSVIQNATKPVSTVRTQKKAMALLAFGIMMGLAAGIGMAFLLNWLDHSVKTNDDIEKGLGLPVLAVLPNARSPRPSLREDVA